MYAIVAGFSDVSHIHIGSGEPRRLWPYDVKPVVGFGLPVPSNPACEWHVMHDEPRTNPSSVTELPRRLVWPVGSTKSSCVPFRRYRVNSAMSCGVIPICLKRSSSFCVGCDAYFCPSVGFGGR